MYASLNEFEGGRLWVQGANDRRDLEVKVRRQKEEVEGSFLGGSAQHAVLDPTKLHYVEPASGTKRTLVAYTPQVLFDVAEVTHKLLHSLGFPLPQALSQPRFTKGPVSAVYHHLPENDLREEELETLSNGGGSQLPQTRGVSYQGDTSIWDETGGECFYEGRSPVCDQGFKACEGELEEGDLQLCRDQLFALRHLILQEERFLQEHMQQECEEGWRLSAEHVRELSSWHAELASKVSLATSKEEALDPFATIEHRRVVECRIRALSLNLVRPLSTLLLPKK